ncbi:neocarzinostatin apoprotein domain-containing protein [Nocardia inohanensis]|uniref:neocarzinostatin apoprotein domain-containing protein n=1 Tax=Nocardia inohanensis TaxID=209246 RepID=UPI00082EE792|nr:neocarzinostatin apoprotein domain-containing protein [Nocardia inohanensis]
MIHTVSARVIATGLLATGLFGPAAGAAADADTRAVITVSASAGLTEGQRITVNGSGFRPGLAAVAVGLCKLGFTSGIKHCDLEGGATFVNISGDGTFPTVTLTAHQRFHDIDCARQQCVIAAAPLPGSEPDTIIAANSSEIPVAFAGAQLPAPAPAAPVAARRSDNVSGPSTPLWAATAVLLAIVSAVALTRRRL